MASNDEEPMDSQDLFGESSQPPPKRQFVITNGAMVNYIKNVLTRKPDGGLYHDQNLYRMLTENNLALRDLSNLGGELSKEVLDAIKFAKLNLKSKVKSLLARFDASGRRWGRNGLYEHDVLFRINDFLTLISRDDFARYLRQLHGEPEPEEEDEDIPASQGSHHSQVSNASSRRSFLEEMHPAKRLRPNNVKTFDEYTNKTKTAKVEELLEVVDRLAGELKTSATKLLCFAAFKKNYVHNRKLARHFESLASGEANPEISIEKASHIKYFCNMSHATYSNLRYLLEDHCDLPTVKRVQEHTTSILPKGLNWNEDIPNAVSAPVESVIRGTLERLPPKASRILESKVDPRYRGPCDADELPVPKYVAVFNSGWDGSQCK